MTLQKNLPPWLPLSFLLAQHLIKYKLHKRFLTNIERKHFEDATSSFATWIAFIAQHENTPIELDTTAFRVRSMLYEQFIPHLFHTHNSCCKVLELEPLIEQARQLTMPSSEDISRDWQTFLDTHIKKLQQPQSPQLQNNTISTPDMNHIDANSNNLNSGEEFLQGML
jgi:transcriptional activator SPT7